MSADLFQPCSGLKHGETLGAPGTCAGTFDGIGDTTWSCQTTDAQGAVTVVAAATTREACCPPSGDCSGVPYDWVGDATIVIPAALAAIGNDASIDTYREFTCDRNLPKCVNNAIQIDGVGECVEKCEAVSDKIAEFSEECLRLEENERIVTENYNPATGNRTFHVRRRPLLIWTVSLADGGPLFVQCYTLATLPIADGGCAEPWCTRQFGGVRGQGWVRNCQHLCTAAAPHSVRAHWQRCFRRNPRP